MPRNEQEDDRVMSLVEMALARPADEREAYLQSACAGDSQLFGQVWNYVESEERMKGFLLDPLGPPPLFEHPFAPGEILDGRFRIVREIAQGGMGIVYEAVDEKLERRIALKCAKIGFSKRLPPEVRHASEISHPNVCKIFEIHTASTEQGEIDFITMEFLDGPTLAERLGGGPLPNEEARAIALQLCAGLAEAHRKQVIHGDLKSNNVILTTGAGGAVRAVITDFGLARRPEASQRTVQSGELGGTPDYMAPELLKGGRASIASDIYALGVILYELVSGRKPERPENSKPRAVHPKWDRILQRCLDPDPARRFCGADEVAQALAPVSRRWFLPAIAAAVLAALTGWVTYSRATAPEASVRLAVLPFDSDAALAPLAERVLRDTTNQFGRLKGNAHTDVEVLSLGDVLRKHADSAEKANAMLGATHVLRGSIEQEKGQLRLRAFITDTRSRVDVKEWRADYGVGEERYVPVALAGLMTGTFHLPPLATVPTVNAGARQDYAAGLASLRHDSSVPAALASFERAVHADPDSALAYAGLAEAQWFKYFLTKQRSWLELSAESARQAERRNPDLAPVHRVAGLHLANEGSYEQASAEYRRAIELEPKDAETYRRLGQVQEKNNQKGEALLAFQTAVSQQPDYYRAHYELGSYYFNRGDYTRAIAPLRKAAELAPGEPRVRFGLGATYMNLGMYAEAEQQLRAAVDLDEAPNAPHTLGVALMYRARDQEAIPFFTLALRRNPENYLSWMYLGIAYRRTNQMSESRDANRRGREMAEAEMARNPRSGHVRSIRGYFAAALGDRARAESEIAQALRLSPDDAETRAIAVFTYEALGQRDSSLVVLSRSSGQQLVDISRWPDVADLQRDPRFIQLVGGSQAQVKGELH